MERREFRTVHLRNYIGGLTMIMVLQFGCVPNHGTSDEIVGEDEWAVAFRISPMGTPNPDTLKLTATWNNGDEHTQFDIVLLTPPIQGDAHFAFSRGWLIARPPSQADAFIRRIAEIHGVEHRYPRPQPVDTMPMSIAILGKDLSRGLDDKNMVAGSFVLSPSGPWMSTKLFLGDGELEIFLNINVEDGVAEFSVKDEMYGSDLLPVLASVMETR